MDGPLADRAEPLGRHADPAVRRRRRRPPRTRASSRRTISAGTPLIRSASSGVKSATASRTRSTPSTYDAGRVRPSANSTCSIASRTTASVPGRTKTCSSATLAVSVRRGSKHDHPAARASAARGAGREVGNGHQGSIRRHRVGAEDQEVRRPVDVGDRDQQLMAVQQPRDELVRELVDASARTDCGCAAPGRVRCHGWRCRVNGRWGCRGRCRRVAAVLVDRAAKPSATRSSASSQLISTQPVGRSRPDRAAQPIGVVVNVDEGDALRADVPARERIVGVAAYVGHPVALERELQAADRLAQVADTDHGAGLVGDRHPGIVPLPAARGTAPGPRRLLTVHPWG